MADDLPLVLALLHDSGTRWSALRAEGEEWIDPEGSKEAFFRSIRPGSVVTGRGAPGPADRDPRWKLWARQPDRSRVEFGRLHPGPPDLVLGQPVPTLVVVARTPSFVVAVDRVVAYPNGFELGVTVRTRDEPVAGSLDTGHRRSWSGTAAFPGESLRVRLYGDLAAVPVSGSGTQTRYDQRFWVAPLPPPEPVTLVVEWPGRGLAETRAELDGHAIVEAASRAEPLWS